LYRYEKETPSTNLCLAMLDRVGVKAERVGDSTGRLENIQTARYCSSRPRCPNRRQSG
jgi:hypothetical protein